MAPASRFVSPGQERVGIVVPIPEPEAGRLGTLRAALGDKYAFVPPHLTLVTGVPVLDWNEVVEHVRGVAADTEPFTIEFGGTDSFRPVTPVVFCRVVAGAERCMRLHERLQAGPLDLPSAYPFVPHVTLAQGLEDTVLDRVQAAEAGSVWSLRADRIALFGDRGDDDWQLRATLSLGDA